MISEGIEVTTGRLGTTVYHCATVKNIITIEAFGFGNTHLVSIVPKRPTREQIEAKARARSYSESKPGEELHIFKFESREAVIDYMRKLIEADRGG